jgi:thiol-disulfide isomerase/thioredoxin
VYPAAGDDIAPGGVMPALSWPDAYAADGSSAPLDLRALYCAPDRPRTLVFVVGAGWCPSCPDYLRQVAGLAPDLERAGARVVYVEVEDANYAPATDRGTYQSLRPVIGAAPGLRVGDGETRPAAGAVERSSIVTAYPSAFVVRVRDMRIVADQGSSAFFLPYLDLVRNPDAL